MLSLALFDFANVASFAAAAAGRHRGRTKEVL